MARFPLIACLLLVHVLAFASRGEAFVLQDKVDKKAQQAALKQLAKASAGELDGALRLAQRECWQDNGRAWKQVLDKRHDRVLKDLQRSLGSGAKELLAEKAELDELRQVALARVFDEVRYFYPPERDSKAYALAQREVEEAVDAVTEVWNSKRKLRLRGRSVAQLEVLRWMTGRNFWKPAKSAPQWYLAIQPSLGDCNVRTLASGEKQRRLLRYNRAVAAWNQEAWDQASELSSEEATQVRITNEYREMMGLERLLWSQVLSQSSRLHVQYLAGGGEFGHGQEEPDLSTPYRRMISVGYEHPANENVTSFAPSGQQAHQQWFGSSDHHRHLLSPDVYEIGVAQEGEFWVQNYGRDPWFRKRFKEMETERK